VRIEGAVSPVQFKAETIPVKVEGKVELGKIDLGKVDFGRIGFDKMQISLDWAGPPLSLPINVPSGGIPVAVELKGWPTATSPLEVKLEGASPSPTAGSSSGKTPIASKSPTPPPSPKGNDRDFWHVVLLILVSGIIGGIANASYGSSAGEKWSWNQILNSIVAAFMVPGVLVLFSENILKTASKDHYHALALVSLCLIAATIGKPFIEFVHDEARWLMERRIQQREASETKASPRPAARRHPRR
jgi:hypothetical protein